MARYVADFETTTKDQYEIDGKVRVWGWGMVNIDDLNEIYLGTSIEDFMRLTYKLKNPTIYFHNLGFDGEFILPFLYNNGFEYAEKAQAHTFNTLISNMGQFYALDVTYKKWRKNKKNVKFLDSLKKLPFSVDRIGKAFHLDVKKLDVPDDFYTRYRPADHELTVLEKEYIINDILVVAKALKIQFDSGLDKMTIGSDALNGFKETLGTKIFQYNFPIFSHEIDSDIRNAYRGGVVWVNPRFQEKDIKENTSYDVVSLYPSVMYYNHLPYGEPIFFDGEYTHNEDYPLYIQKLSVAFDLKDDHMPTIQIKGNPLFKSTEYIETTNNNIVTLYLTNIDLQLLKDHYHIKYIEYHNGWMFRGVTGIFKEYIDHWMSIKDNSTGAERELAKLMLNSLYGKFATNPDVTGKIPYMDNGIIKYGEQEETLRDPVYTAMGVFITSYAREKTIRTAQKVFDRFIYCDTDSIHLVGHDVPDINIGNKLGQWEHEGNYKRARFLRAKTYIKEEQDGEMIVKGAGMPDVIKKQVTWDNFRDGFTAYGKLKPKRVEGGVYLEPTTFTIKL